MALNKIPFTGIYSIASISDGANLVSSILAGGVPLCAQAASGGRSEVVLLPPGQNTIASVMTGNPQPDELNASSLWVVRFSFQDPANLQEIFTVPGSFAGRGLNSLLQEILNFECGKNYIFDTASISGLVIENIAILNQLKVYVWELYQS